MNAVAKLAVHVASVLTVSLAGAAGYAGTITDLYNTGVDASAATIPTVGTDDPHYRIVSPGPGQPAKVSLRNTAWVANPVAPGGGRWISLNANAGAGTARQYVYETLVTVPNGADLASVKVSGAWASDNVTTNILVNLTPTGRTNPAREFRSLTPFSIQGSGLFRHGTNSLRFVVSEQGVSHGLLVTNLRGTFVPEPSSGVAAIVGLATLGVVRRR